MTRRLELPLAIATPRRLRNRRKSGKRTINHREIDIHPSLDQLRADDTNLLSGFQRGFDYSNYLRAVCTAHRSGKVNRSRRHQVEQFTTIAARVNDAQHLTMRGQLIRDFRPCLPRPVGHGHFPFCSLKSCEEIHFGRNDLGYGFQPGQVWLRRRRQHHGRAVMRGKLLDCKCARLDQVHRQKLHLVENNDAVGKVVQFAATARFAGIKRLEELNTGRHDDGSIPIFGCQTRAGRLLLRIEIAVMLQDILRAKDATQNICRLFNDRGVGDYKDYTFLPVFKRMTQGKRHRRKRLAAAGWDGQRVNARLAFRHQFALLSNLGANPVHFSCFCLTLKLI